MTIMLNFIATSIKFTSLVAYVIYSVTFLMHLRFQSLFFPAFELSFLFLLCFFSTSELRLFLLNLLFSFRFFLTYFLRDLLYGMCRTKTDINDRGCLICHHCSSSQFTSKKISIIRHFFFFVKWFANCSVQVRST